MWQAMILGREPEFADLDQADELLGLIARLNNEVAGQLGSGEFLPLGWCCGYLAGSSSRAISTWSGEKVPKGNVITDPSKQTARALTAPGA
jgi:hypothetical protein